MDDESMNYYVVLDDGETYAEIGGCIVIGLRPGNQAAYDALDGEDLETAIELADLCAPVEPPRPAIDIAVPPPSA